MKKTIGVFFAVMVSSQMASADQVYVRCQGHGGDLMAHATDESVWIRNFFDIKPFFEGVMSVGNDREHKVSEGVRGGRFWVKPLLKLWYVGPEWTKTAEAAVWQRHASVQEITNGDVKQVIHTREALDVDVETYQRLPRGFIFEMEHGLVHHKALVPAGVTHAKVHFRSLPEVQFAGFVHGSKGVLGVGSTLQLSRGYDCVLHVLPSYVERSFTYE